MFSLIKLYFFSKTRLKQLTDSEQNSLKTNLELCKTLFLKKHFPSFSFSSVRHNVDQWLYQTLQHNEQLHSIDNYHDDQSFIENQLITYFHNELNKFDEILPSLNQHLNNPKLINRLQQRRNSIENILQEKMNHQEILQQIQKQINELTIDCNKEELLEKFNKTKENFNRIKNQEYFEIQPILGVRLELAIRTLDADLQLIEQILEGKTLEDIIPSGSLITTKISLQSNEPQIHQDTIDIRNNLSTIAKDIKVCRAIKNEKKMISEDLLRTDLVSDEKYSIDEWI